MNAFVEIDVHSMMKVQTVTAIDAKLRRADASVYRLRVIRGNHGGTALRDGIRECYVNRPKVKRADPGLDPGITDPVLREF